MRGPIACSFALVVVSTAVAPPVGAQDGARSVIGLLPRGAVLDSGSWNVVETAASGSVRGTFSSAPNLCNRAGGSELTLDVRGDSSWTGTTLDKAAEQLSFNEQAVRASLTEEAASLLAAKVAATTSAVQVETTSHGRFAYFEYTESCEERANAHVARITGGGRRGTAFMTFDLTLTTGLADAKTVAAEVLERFQKFDLTAAIK
jgi:hypothetical protein